MPVRPNTSLNERTKHCSSTFMVSVSVPSMSNIIRCMGELDEADDSDQQTSRTVSYIKSGHHNSQWLAPTIGYTSLGGKHWRLAQSNLSVTQKLPFPTI